MDLPPELVERAARELNETSESRLAGLAELHAYYAAHSEEQPHRTDDPYLLMFLRHAKFDPVRARGRLAAVERWLRDCADDIGDIDKIRGPMFKEMMDKEFFGRLSSDRRTRDGACMALLRLRNLEAPEPTILLRWQVWVLKRAVHDPYVQVGGMVMLQSLTGFSLMHSGHFRQVQKKVGQKNFKFMGECVPFRVRGIYFVHQPSWWGLLFAVVKPFLSAKLKSRIRLFGGNLPALHELIDPAYLPEELGGSHPDTGRTWYQQQCALEAAEEAAGGAGAEAQLDGDAGAEPTASGEARAAAAAEQASEAAAP
ncbi:hypothetical protein HYH03_013669 [Edaphochlamys debaryana]|uniref:CRAL-TRIO domain-containing protein n=1 Tax=Edaphochlamys debaryana TaxID=47281 RepID=A0A835XP71_9CHLO|nr:hypothetical protein HYH03_013669 [Edaphochlamys debaryana]|eukprot:KAG2487668.1 hypothetical protein HYH03_013669 [Edaphochlamys debaryana]